MSARELSPATAEIAVAVRGVSKHFRVYERPIDRMFEAFSRKPRHRVFEALRGIDLEIMRGETVGIVGRNGSGKSTLLQLIAGTLHPSAGEVVVCGRIAALLELGSGFNPEFSGRENVYLNAQVMGLRRQQIEDRFSRIEQFADIGGFIDQPVRTYSSGMLVRLAFAVAINTDPDILIIDEALAVGDEAFQRKCFARIEEIKRGGATILFVSHAAESVINLCDRAVLLDAGERLLTGRPKDVIGRFQRLLHAPREQQDALRRQIRAFDAAGPDVPAARDEIAPITPRPDAVGESDALDSPAIRPWPVPAEERFDVGFTPQSTVDYCSRGVRIVDPHLVSADGGRVNVLMPGHGYALRYRVEFDEEAREVEFGMAIKSVDGIVLFGMSSQGRGGFIPHLPAGSAVEVEFRFLSRFQPGAYFLNVGCQGVPAGGGGRDWLHRILDAACFRIQTPSSDRYMTGFYDLSDEPAVSVRPCGG